MAEPLGGEASALGPLIGSGKVAEVFAFGERVAKFYRSPADKLSTFREAMALALAHSLGLPAPAVWGVRQFAERWAIVMDRVDGPNLGEAVRQTPEQVPAVLAGMVGLHGKVHAQPGRHLGSLKARLARNIAAVDRLGLPRQRRLGDGLAVLPDGDRLCHGDFHPWNILGRLGGDLMLVDWLDACCGEPAADVCRSYVLIHPHLPNIANAYVDAYALAAAVDRHAVLRWLPYVAAARIAENVPDETDGLMAMVDTL